MIELTMQVSEFDYTETLDTFLPDLIKILSESEGVNPLIRKCVGASPEFSKKIVKGILAAMSPKILLNAKKNSATATKMLPEAPISFVSACWVSCTPLEEPSKGAPLKRMINAVQVQINKVSVNTASVCINPCLTG